MQRLYNIPNKIVFFDGECMLCNSFIKFLIRKNLKNIYFARLQSETASNILCRYSIKLQNLNTIYYYQDGKVYNRSTAIFRIIGEINLIYNSITKVLLLIPKPLRDITYSIIAKHRHKWVKNNYCVLLTTQQQLKILSEFSAIYI